MESSSPNLRSVFIICVLVFKVMLKFDDENYIEKYCNNINTGLLEGYISSIRA